MSKLLNLILTQFLKQRKYDIIISNPPYLHPSEKNQLDKNVKYEPDIALFTPKDNPLHFMRKFWIFVSINLTKRYNLS